MFSKIIDSIRTLFTKEAPPTTTSPSQKSAKKSSQPSPAKSSVEQGEKRKKPRRRKRPEGPKWDISQFKVAPEEGKTRFHDLNLPDVVMHAIADLKFEYCTPVQAEILAATLKGQDATGKAQTGTGKTAAFLLTVLDHLVKNPPKEKRKVGTPRALIIAPTRELVIQIGKDARALSKYSRASIVTVYGGTDYKKQRERLESRPVDIIVATPGRLIDFKNQRKIDLGKVEIMVLDEADRMLDMGFIPDVKKIIYSTPPKEKRQTLLFSATLPTDVLRLARQWTKDPLNVDIEPEQVAVDTVDQKIYIVTRSEKFALVYNIITKKNLERVIIFSNRREDTRKLDDLFYRYGIDCKMLTGDVPQRKRTKTLEDFRAGKIRVLAATDVAGRGIHIDGLDHVINFTLPLDPEDYVHRIGRTGRAGASGTSISFADEGDSFQIPLIEEFIGRKLDCTTPEEDWLDLPEPTNKKARPRKQSDNRGSRGGRGRGRSGGSRGGGNNSNGRPRRSPSRKRHNNNPSSQNS